MPLKCAPMPPKSVDILALQGNLCRMTTPSVQYYLASGGTLLAFRRYDPPSDSFPTPCGTVIYLHGIQSHGGWYDASCRHLASRGLRVYLPDRRGSGLNESARGHCDSWEQLADDVMHLTDLAESQWMPQIAAADNGRRTLPSSAPSATGATSSPKSYRPPPIILIGVSWGGKLAAALAAMHGGRYAGVALACPGIEPRQDVSLRTKFAIARSVIRGRLRRQFDIPLNAPELFTATPRWLEFVNNDKLALRQATAGFLFQSRRLDSYLRDAWPWIRDPLLLVLAGRDRIINNAATAARVTGAGSSQATVRIFGDGHHTLEFESDPQPFFRCLADWCVARCQERLL